MGIELDIFQLGKILKKLNEEYNVEIMTKIALSGGWMTMTGKIEVEKIPLKPIGGFGLTKGSNIIDIKVITENSEGGLIKLTGAKDKKFKIEIGSSKYRNLRPSNSSDETFINEEETKLKIDKDIIFKIDCRKEEVEKIIGNS